MQLAPKTITKIREYFLALTGHTQTDKTNILLSNSELNILVATMTNENLESDELIQTQRFIKDRLQNDKITFFNHAEQRQSIYDLLERSATFGESNIALLIGVRGSGKTAVSIPCNFWI